MDIKKLKFVNMKKNNNFVFLLITTLLISNEIKDNNKDLKQKATELHYSSYVIDLHTDALYFHMRGKKDITKRSQILEVDIPRLKEGGVDGQVFAIWPNPRLLKKKNYAKFVYAAIDTFKQICQRESVNISLALSPKDVYEIAAQNKIAGILAIEGGHALEGRLDMLDTFYNLGVRLITITWNNSNELADAQLDTNKPNNGLSKLGIQAIKRMNELGIIIDVSHASEKSFWDIINISTAPIIASHSAVRTLRNHKRNLTDKQIIAIAKKRGVIGIIFRSSNLSKTPNKSSIEDVLNHIDYIVKLVGVDFVALGSDFDGLMEKPPKKLEDASKFSNITYALKKRKYSDEDIKKILGENFIRVWNEVERVSKKER